MFELPEPSVDIQESWRTLLEQLEHLMAGEANFVSNMANAAALLFYTLEDINWAGFYLWDAERDQLVLGPFQGRPACVRIGLGKGVCGTAVAQNMSQRVEDVLDFPGHIACDSKSRSELVVPLRQGRTIIGVLDLDSPIPRRFSQIDQDFCELFAARLVAHHTS